MNDDLDIAELLDKWQAAARQNLAESGIVALVAINPFNTKAKNKTADKSPPEDKKPTRKSKKAAAEQSEDKPAPATANPDESKPAKIKYRVEILDDDELPKDLDVASGMELFLATLGGKSKETVRTYRTGCRRFLCFLYLTGRGDPSKLVVAKLPVSILERYHDWLLTNYTAESSNSGGNSSQKSTNTISGYITAARNLFEYLASRNVSPSGVQYQRLVARLPKLQGRGGGYRTPRALRTRQNQEAIEQLAQVAATGKPAEGLSAPIVSESEFSADISSEPEKPLREKRKREIHDPAELERRRLEAARNRAIILTLYTTGMRRHEVAGLNRPDLESLLTLWNKDKAKRSQVADKTDNQPEATENDAPKPVYELIIRGKGSKERFVYFDEVTLTAIEEYLTMRGNDGYRPLFLQHHRGRDARDSGDKGDNWRVGTGTVWEIAVDFGRDKLGVKIRPHDFRHNLATVLLNAGAKLEEVQDLLGHSSPATTKMIYAHYSQQHLKDVFSRYRNSADRS